MKKNLQIQFTTVIIFLYLFNITSYCQPFKHIKGDIAIPHMWVDKETSKSRISWFMENKYQLLCDTIDQPEASFINYDTAGFKAMINSFDGYNLQHSNSKIDSIHIYFAVYAQQPNVHVYKPKDENLLTIIFVPVDVNKKPVKITGAKSFYYIISDIKNVGFTSLDSSIATGWIDLYQSRELKVLTSTIDPSDVENYFLDSATNDSILSDTRMLRYNYNYFREIQTEVEYQRDVHNYKIPFVRAVFAAYTDAGDVQHFGMYPQRLIIMFGLTRRNNSYKIINFNIEDDQEDFKLRKRNNIDTLENLNKKFNEFILQKKFNSDDLKKLIPFISGGGGGLDNGQLCPTYCPNIR